MSDLKKKKKKISFYKVEVVTDAAEIAKYDNDPYSREKVARAEAFMKKAGWPDWEVGKYEEKKQKK